MRLTPIFAGLIASLALTAPANAASFRDTSVPMKAQDINLKSYLGKWYEIARYPNNFERNCQGVTAEYSMREDGNIKVLNTCRKGSPDGPANSRTAVGEVVGPGKLKVDFVSWLPGVARGDYWVLYVDGGYDLAVVGEPSGKFGWILSRTPQIRQSQLEEAYTALRKNGYDTSKIQLIAQ